MDRFKRIREIGGGGFGEAYLVERKTDGKKFVIKDIVTDTLDEQGIAFAQEEATKMQNLTHANIVRYEDAWRDERDEHFYILMEYCESGDLEDHIRRQVKEMEGCHFSEKKIVNWFGQICAALKHCHDRNVLHRDIKAGNIFMTKDRKQVKLGDFGAARILELDTYGGVRAAKTVIGTVSHMAPEMWDRSGYTQAMDIWSLGVVLYQMCALRAPFLPPPGVKDWTDSDWCQAAKRGQYEPLPDFFSNQLKDVVAKCLTVNPNQRPNIDEVIELVTDMQFDS